MSKGSFDKDRFPCSSLIRKYQITSEYLNNKTINKQIIKKDLFNINNYFIEM